MGRFNQFRSPRFMQGRFAQGWFRGARDESTPPIITATTAPSIGTLTDGDTVQSAYTAGSYASTAGTIASAVETVTINGTTGALADVVSFDDVVSVSVLVTDSAGNTQTFNAGAQTVQAADTAEMLLTLSGDDLVLTASQILALSGDDLLLEAA